MKKSEHIKIWDPFVRLFHWVLLLAFVTAFITEDDFLNLHTLAGYIVIGLLLFRFVWGFIGSCYARFDNFVYSGKVIAAYLGDVFRFKARRYLGHNPAGGAMIILLLISLLLTTATGLAVYAAGDASGPLALWLAYAGEVWASRFEDAHEFFANFTVLLVVIHVGGVLVESLLHRENLIIAMLTGNKQLNPEKQRGA